MYLGHSPKHARSVALVLNITTDHVSPQYHLDDDFTTVQSMRVRKVPVNWEGLVTRQRESAMNEQFKLQTEWQNQQASAYPQSTLNIMDWPSEDATIRKEMRVENKQGQMKSNKGDVADMGGCPCMIKMAAASANDGEVRTRNDGSHVMAINSPLFFYLNQLISPQQVSKGF